MEQICEARKADNLPALAIQWGAIGEVGVVADFAEDNLDIVIGKMSVLPSQSEKLSSLLQPFFVANRRYSSTKCYIVPKNIGRFHETT